jgi:hypothetical protein
MGRKYLTGPSAFLGILAAGVFVSSCQRAGSPGDAQNSVTSESVAPQASSSAAEISNADEPGGNYHDDFALSCKYSDSTGPNFIIVVSKSRDVYEYMAVLTQSPSYHITDVSTMGDNDLNISMGDYPNPVEVRINRTSLVGTEQLDLSIGSDIMKRDLPIVCKVAGANEITDVARFVTSEKEAEARKKRSDEEEKKSETANRKL